MVQNYNSYTCLHLLFLLRGFPEKSVLLWRLFFKTRWKIIGFCLMGVLLLEVFVFNLPTWQTVRAVPSVYSISSLHTGAVKESTDGIVTTASNATVNVTSEKIIKYLYFEVPSEYESSSHIVNYSVGISYSGDKYNSLRKCNDYGFRSQG